MERCVKCGSLQIYGHDIAEFPLCMYCWGAKEYRLPYVVPQKTNRNELCPCGSGKKYKNVV